MDISTGKARPHYDKAVLLGKKEGGSLVVLDELLAEAGLKSLREIPLGIQDITLEQIVGTKTEGRKNCFSKSFYPIMKADTEFAGKWIALCASHLEVGIHTPIKVYEYFGKYYVLEGNKRVSVSKYFDTYSISADVIRLLPPLTDTPETRLYFEYLDFYTLSKINYLFFTKPQGFVRLLRLVGKKRNERWTDDERLNMNSAFTRFRLEYTKLMGVQNYQLVSDAFLSFITIYDYAHLTSMTATELKEKIGRCKEEFTLLLTPDAAKLQMDPFNKKPGLIQNLVPKVLTKQKVAFIHAKTPDHSGWTYSHERGRRHMEAVFQDSVTTTVYYDVDNENIGNVLEDAIDKKHHVIFTTSPIFLKETLRAAVEHPEIKFLNCTPHMCYKHVRTYYARMYEVKFLLGAIAGSMAENNKIGYIADYPIIGTISNVNAFALGAKMVNPRAQVYLRWSKQQYDSEGREVTMADVYKEFQEKDISIICDRDTQYQNKHTDRIGLYMVNGSEVWNMALPVWNWGSFYEKTIDNIMNGNWKTEEQLDNSKGIRYWWGLSSGLLNIIPSSRLPIGTIRLIDLLRNQIAYGDFNPFTGALYSQDREIQSDPHATLSPYEILDMDWLAENVIGEIPEKAKLSDQAKEVAAFAGIEEKVRIL